MRSIKQILTLLSIFLAVLPAEKSIKSAKNTLCMGVVARFDPGSIWAAFPAPPSRHHGVGLWPAELDHPVEDVTPDHGLSRMRDAAPRPQVASEY